MKTIKAFILACTMLNITATYSAPLITSEQGKDVAKVLCIAGTIICGLGSFAKAVEPLDELNKPASRSGNDIADLLTVIFLPIIIGAYITQLPCTIINTAITAPESDDKALRYSSRAAWIGGLSLGLGALAKKCVGTDKAFNRGTTAGLCIAAGIGACALAKRAFTKSTPAPTGSK